MNFVFELTEINWKTLIYMGNLFTVFAIWYTIDTYIPHFKYQGLKWC